MESLGGEDTVGRSKRAAIDVIVITISITFTIKLRFPYVASRPETMTSDLSIAVEMYLHAVPASLVEQRLQFCP